MHDLANTAVERVHKYIHCDSRNTTARTPSRPTGFNSQNDRHMAETPMDTNELSPFRFAELPLEIRQMILERNFQNLVTWIENIPFTRPVTNPLSRPRFPQHHEMITRHRTFAMLHVSHSVRFESFDTYMSLALDLWRSIMADDRRLREERSKRGDAAVWGDNAFLDGYYRTALRAEGAMHIVSALTHAEANSNRAR